MYRNKGLNAIKIVCSNTEAIYLENIIHEQSDNQEEYYLIIQEMINIYRSNKDIEYIVELLQSKKYLFRTDEYQNYSKKLEEIDNFLMKPFEVDEGVLTCNKCNSNKTFSYTKQTRSGDESTTVFVICSECNAKWKI